MTVTLSHEAERFVEEQLRVGGYASAEDAVNSLLKHLSEQERLTDEGTDELRAEVDVGLAEAERGEFVQFTAQDVIAERRAALAARREGK